MTSLSNIFNDRHADYICEYFLGLPQSFHSSYPSTRGKVSVNEQQKDKASGADNLDSNIFSPSSTQRSANESATQRYS